MRAKSTDVLDLERKQPTLVYYGITTHSVTKQNAYKV